MAAIEKTFEQTDLISSTGKQINEGICLGLVCQWLIAISKGVSGDENQFWSDINESLASTPNVPLLGIGYARKAIEFQEQYLSSLTLNLGTGYYAQGEMKKTGLSLTSAKYDSSVGAFRTFSKSLIVSRVLSENGRYSILGIRGIAGCHTIGIFRLYSAAGKSDKVRIFEPNIGLYTCQGGADIESVLDTIDVFYGTGLHDKYFVETYI